MESYTKFVMDVTQSESLPVDVLSPKGTEPITFLDDPMIETPDCVRWVDTWTQQHLFEKSGIKEYVDHYNKTGIEDVSCLSSDVQARFQQSQAQLHELKDAVESKKIPEEEINTDEGDILIFDVDKTITDPHYRGPGETDKLLPGSAVFDPYIGEKREHFEALLAAGWVKQMGLADSVFRRGGADVPIREGMSDLLEGLIDQGKKVKIITTNFEPFIESMLEKMFGGAENMPDNNLLEVFCIRKNDVRSIAKGDLLKLIALKNPNATLSYIGDGSSDAPAIEARDVIDNFYALEGEWLDGALKEHNIDHATFTTGQDIAQKFGIALPAAA